MTDKQARFIEEYCIDFNATQAAIRSGYSEKTAKAIGHENLTKPDISEAVKKRLDELSMSAAEATKRLTDWGRGTLEPFMRAYEDGGMVFDLTTEEARKNIGLIREIERVEKRYTERDEPVEEIKTKIRLHDAKDAVIQIAKIRGIYAPERIEGTVRHSHLNLSPDDLKNLDTLVDTYFGFDD